MSKAEKTKQHLIEHAAVIFNEKGIAGTSVDEIILASRSTKGCFYGHFDSKEELSYASVDYLLNKLTERRTSALEKQKTATGKIHAFLEMNKSPLNSFVNGGCPIVNFATESDDTNPVIQKKIKAMVQKAISLFVKIIEDGITNGEFTEALIPIEFATKMFLSIEGGNAICRVLNSTKPMQTVIKSLKSELASYATHRV